MAISPNGKVIATSERDSPLIYVWDIESRQLLWKAENGSGWVSDMAFTPDSQHLYVANRRIPLRNPGTNPWQGWEGQVRVWDVKSAQQIDTFGTKFYDLKTITLSPDGQKALLHFRDGEVLWDIKEKQQRNVWADFVRYLWYSDIELSPDGKTFAFVSSYFIKTWDVASQQMRLLVSAEGYQFRGFAISPDSQKLAVGKNPWVDLRDIKTGKIETQLPHFLSYR